MQRRHKSRRKNPHYKRHNEKASTHVFQISGLATLACVNNIVTDTIFVTATTKETDSRAILFNRNHCDTVQAVKTFKNLAGWCLYLELYFHLWT